MGVVEFEDLVTAAVAIPVAIASVSMATEAVPVAIASVAVSWVVGGVGASVVGGISSVGVSVAVATISRSPLAEKRCCKGGKACYPFFSGRLPKLCIASLQTLVLIIKFLKIIKF